VVLGIINEHHPDGVFNPATLRRIYELTAFAKTLRWPDAEHPGRSAGVIEVDMIAPSLVDHISQGGPGTLRFDWLMPRPPNTREEALAVRDRALSNPLLVKHMVSGDGKAMCLYLPLTDKLLSYRVYTELNKKIAQLSGSEDYHITGLPVAEGAIGVEMFSQMTVASPLAMLVIFSLLLLFFRKWRLIVVPMIIATVSIVCAMGLMTACGFSVHILSSMLPIFLMSIAMVDSVHVLSEFFDVYTPEKGRRQTIQEVMHTLFTPMLYTSLTTSAGFLSLVLAPIPPARVFGGFLSLGVMVAWLVTVLFVPAYVMMMPEARLAGFGLAAQRGAKDNWLTRGLRALGRVSYGHAKPVLALLLVLVVVAVWGISRIRINDNYAKRFAVGHPIREADRALNRHFGGTYTAYLVLEGRDDARATPSEVRRLRQDLLDFSRAIRGEYPAAPRLARQVTESFDALAGKAPALDDFLDAAMGHMDALAEQAPDEDYFALQELHGHLGLAREQRKTFKRPEVLAYMTDLQAHLEKSGLIGKSTSVADVVRKVNQELIDGRPEHFRLPDTAAKVAECYLQYQQSHRPNDLWHLVTPDYMQANIRMQFPTGDSMNTRATVAAVETYVENHPPPAALGFHWAGLHYINRVLEARLVWGFLKSFAGSFLIVFVMMTFLFRSALWGGLCMLPLTITLLAIYGLTGLVGKDYDLPIAVLSALSIGMAVDFAIHFLQRSRVAYAKKGSWQAVVPEMFGEPARAISRNVLVIAIGFLPLLVASLVPYKTTGLMLCMILSCSGLVTLLALPAILTVAERWFFKPGTSKKNGQEPMVEPRERLKSSGRDTQVARKTASLILFFSGLVVLVSSLVLYVGPPTHVAHFSDWRFAGLTKCRWNALHISAGLLFVIAMLLHVWFNRKPMKAYLGGRKRRALRWFSPSLVALFLTVYVCAGTCLGWPPMNRGLQWLRSVKIDHVRTYGAPPYGGAEQASLEIIATYMGWDAQGCLTALRRRGLNVASSGQSLKAIARNNGLSIGAVLDTMRP
jgi:hypothetical protein